MYGLCCSRFVSVCVCAHSLAYLAISIKHSQCEDIKMRLYRSQYGNLLISATQRSRSKKKWSNRKEISPDQIKPNGTEKKTLHILFINLLELERKHP